MNSNDITNLLSEQEKGFFELLKETFNKEGIIIYTSSNTLKIGISSSLVEILYHAWHTNLFRATELEDFFNQYILNWNNETQNYRNYQISENDFQRVRHFLVVNLTYDPTIWTNTIEVMYNSDNILEGIFIDYNININNGDVEIQRWNNQIC